MKKVFKSELLIIFIISIITGLLGQTLIPSLSSKIVISFFKFDVLVSNIDIYTFVIVFLICYKNPEPKKCFERIVIYFIGLCIGYYGYTSLVNIYNAITVRPEYLSNILLDIKDSITYIIVSLLAGLWGYIMIKYKSNRILFYIMTLPFVAVSLIMFYENIFICEPMKLFMGIVDILSIIGIIICVYNYKFDI